MAEEAKQLLVKRECDRQVLGALVPSPYSLAPRANKRAYVRRHRASHLWSHTKEP
jgi:hypothetical protein